MVNPGLIGSAHPGGLDMIGCIRLLEMAVMIAGFPLRQIRAWKYKTRLNDTTADCETARPAGRPFLAVVAKESDPHAGRIVRDFFFSIAALHWSCSSRPLFSMTISLCCATVERLQKNLLTLKAGWGDHRCVSLLVSWVSPEQTLQDCGGADLSGEGGMQRRRKVVAASAQTFSPVDFTWVTTEGRRLITTH